MHVFCTRDVELLIIHIALYTKTHALRQELSLTAPTEMVEPAPLQPLRHAPHQLLQIVPLLARWHGRVSLEEVRHPRAELVLAEHATGTKISLFTHG